MLWGRGDARARTDLRPSAGGTVDITAHEVRSIEPLQLRELMTPKGGPWGSTNTDVKFSDFLRDVLTPELFNTLPANLLLAVAELWEQCKVNSGVNAADAGTAVYSFNLGNIMARLRKSGCATPLTELVAQYNERTGRAPGSSDAIGATAGVAAAAGPGQYNLLTVPFSVCRSFIDDVIAQTAEYLTCLLTTDTRLKKMSYVLLLGGFAASARLQVAVRRVGEDHGFRVFTPRNPAIAVVKGAMEHGMRDSSYIASRVMRRSVGLAACETWNATDHDPARGAVKELGVDNVMRVVNLFHMLVQVDDEVEVDHSETVLVAPTTGDLESVTVTFYSAKTRGVRYVSEAGCAILATVTTPCSGRWVHPRTARGVELTLRFGRVELNITARDVLTNEEVVVPVTYETLVA